MARRRQRQGLKTLVLPDALLLDSEGLSGAAAGHVRVRAELALAERLGASVHVSAVTLAETLRGSPRDARLHALLKGVDQEAVTPELGRAAGELLGRTGRSDTTDAIVAVTARGLGRKVRILTSDPHDLRALTTEMHGISVVPV
ncbi:MAG TPA: PIN domain-containing protein [Acidimicrobiales bacterium]|nr:PIN domain-containing protein [Acidimicrobiales bacterium]